jgi:hypothetical protein
LFTTNPVCKDFGELHPQVGIKDGNLGSGSLCVQHYCCLPYLIT